MPRKSLRALLFVVLLATTAATASETVEIVFENGDKLEVIIIEENHAEIIVNHPQLGRLVIPRNALKRAAKEKPGLFGTGFLQGWKRNLGAGISGSTGNSSDASVNASVSASRSTSSFKGNFQSSFFFATSDGERTTNDVFADYQHDFLLSDSAYFIFVQGRYQYDEFQAWRHRLSTSTGLGYDIANTKTWGLNVQLGFGTARTWGSEREWRAEGVLGFNFNWEPTQGHELTADTTYYPDFNHTPGFRLLSNAAYTMGITQIQGLSMKTGVKNEYDSGQPGKNNSLKYYGNLVYDF